MELTCNRCWTRYPAGTTRCRRCKQPLTDVQQHIRADRPAREYMPTLPGIVRPVRWLLLLRAMCVALPLAVAVGRPDIAPSLYGGAGAAYLADRVAGMPPASVILGVIAVGMAAWIIPAILARWYLGRMLLLAVIGLSEFLRFVVFRSDIGLLANQIDLIATLLLLAAMAYATARPE